MHVLGYAFFFVGSYFWNQDIIFLKLYQEVVIYLLLAFVHINNKLLDVSPLELAKKAEQLGAGELFINSVDLDGMMTGYDIMLFQEICKSVSIPVVACGGAGKIADLREALQKASVDAVAAGSMFVYHGKHRAVLINYITKEDRFSLQNL